MLKVGGKICYTDAMVGETTRVGCRGVQGAGIRIDAGICDMETNHHLRDPRVCGVACRDCLGGLGGLGSWSKGLEADGERGRGREREAT